MSPDPTTPGEAGDGQSTPPRQIPVADDRSFSELVPQFFIFPLLIVTVGVLVWVSFVKSAQDERPIADILVDLQSAWFQTRNQAAFELAMRSRDLDEEEIRFTREESEQIASILTKNRDNAKVRQWLVYALGRAGDLEVTMPVLLEVLRDDDNLESRVEAIRGLGLARSRAAIGPLTEQLEKFGGESDWEPRLITLSALANIVLAADVDPQDRERVVELLRKHLEDPRWSVRWNMATNLAIQFKDPAGIPILRRMLDRSFLREHVPENFHQDPYIVEAIRGLIALEDRESYPLIEDLRNDPSAKVRNAVFTFRDALSTADAGPRRRGERADRRVGFPRDSGAPTARSA